MADFINQLSNTPNVFWYIDSVETFDISYVFTGWIVSTNPEIEVKDLKISTVKMGVDFLERPDVASKFSLESNKVGFRFYTDRRNINLDEHPVFMIDQNGVEHNVGLLSKWIALYSGFNNVKHQSVVVVDNFYKDPDYVRQFAMNNIKFSPSNYHKGERAVDRFILAGTKERFEEILGRKVTNWNHEAYANGIFQFCTADQPIVYHIDTQTYAGIVFLTPDAPLPTGTAFYKSKVTGLTRFTDEQRDSELYYNTFKGLSDAPNFYDSTQYEKVDEVANVYNRLVLFDARTIHAATQYFGDAIHNARFFHMFFFDVE